MSEVPNWPPDGQDPQARASHEAPPASVPPQPGYGQPAPAAQGWAPPPGWSSQQPPAWGAPPAAGPAPQPAGYPHPGAQPPAGAYRTGPYQQPGAYPPSPQQPGQGAWGPGWGQPVAAPKPGIVALRPLGVGELLDGALGLIRSNPKTVLGLAAAVSAISAVLQTIGVWASYAILGVDSFDLSATSADVEGQLTASLASTAIQIVPAMMAALLQVVAGGLFMVLVAAAVLGRKLDAGATWTLLRPRLLGLLGLSLLVAFVSLAFFAALIGVVVVAGMALGGVGVLLGVLFALAAGLAAAFIYVRFALASPALVIEAISPIAALGRSWRLVTGSFWRVLGILLLAAIIVNVLTTVVTVPFLTVAMVATAASEAMWPVILATGIATLISGIVTLPFSAAVTGLLYTDLRIRREALDIELISAGVAPDGDPLAPYRRRVG